jgi:general secretion pathway protein K
MKLATRSFRHSGAGRNPVIKNILRSRQNHSIAPLSRDVFNLLDSGLRRNDGVFSGTRRSSQHGVAVIMVMLIVAIATTLAVYVSQQQSLWQRQVETQFDHTQARRLGTAGIDWARAVLADDGRNIDHETEMWTLRLPAMPVENGEVLGIIEDRQGLFNLNSLVRDGASSAKDVAKFQNLLSILNLPAELAPALADWIDADSEVQTGGAEDSYYLALPRPYRTANQPLTELGELSKVRGFDSKTIERLKPFVAVLPVNGEINVNFAPAEVLTAIAQNLSLSEARMLVQQRRGNPFTSTKNFTDRLPNKNLQINESDITVSSTFFWITGRASVNNSQVVTQALVRRDSTGWPVVVWQSVQ